MVIATIVPFCTSSTGISLIGLCLASDLNGRGIWLLPPKMLYLLSLSPKSRDFCSGYLRRIDFDRQSIPGSPQSVEFKKCDFIAALVAMREICRSDKKKNEIFSPSFRAIPGLYMSYVNKKY